MDDNPEFLILAEESPAEVILNFAPKVRQGTVVLLL